MQLLSVTQVLSPFADFSKVNPAVLAWAAKRGTAVHSACAAHAQRLPCFGLSEDAEPYFDSFCRWFDRYVRRVLFVECEFSDPTYGIVGHLDLVAELIDGRLVVVDYKTPAAESRLWRAQIAAYCYLVSPVVPGVVGMALMLSGAGKPAKAITYEHHASDFAAFLAALTAYRYFKP